MTDTNYDDRGLSVLFTVIGVLGILPALYGLYTAGLVAFATIGSVLKGHTLDLEALPVAVGFISVTLSGFWLLVQYIRVAHGKEASVPRKTLWRHTTIQNVIYLLAALALFITQIDGFLAIWGGLGVVWFAMLTTLSARAAAHFASPAGA